MTDPDPERYIRLLPAIFYDSGLEGKGSFIRSYLKIFEKILSGINDGKLEGQKGFGEILDIVPELFHPRFSFLFERTNGKFLPPLEEQQLDSIQRYFGSKSWRGEQTNDFLDEFLTWLASWMALVLKEDWTLERKREAIARIIPIYRMRGTKKGIEEFLRIYVGGDVKVSETEGTFQVGSSQVGVNTLIKGGMIPYVFTVKVTFPKIQKEEQTRFLKNLKILLDSEKPVHTSYLLKVSTPTLQIGIKEGSTVGRNTLVGGTFTEISVE
ncbi:MAG: phage tail protein [Methanosarcina sp.]